MIVVDASVAVKWYIEEDDSALARTIALSIISGTLEAAAPDLILYELTNALRLKPSVPPDAVEHCLRRLGDLGIDIVEPTPKLMSHAIALARRYTTSAYDAAYLALALDRKGQLVAADARFVSAATPSAACTLLADFRPE